MESATTPTQRLAAGAVHVFTASGAAVAMLAAMAAIERDFTSMFAWLGLGLFIDGADGTMARAARVKTLAPRFNGEILDLVVDYLNYVLVPVLALWRSGLIGPEIAVVLCPLVAMASALYFADKRMKTADNWFRGFPALWNVVALYLFAFRPPQAAGATLVVLFAVAMFAPVAFVHPVRVGKFRTVTICVTILWFACAGGLVASAFAEGAPARLGLAAAGIYFLGLSLWRSLTGPPEA